jgi:hypothetical protein
MSRFGSDPTKYACINIRRETGLLEMRFHPGNHPLGRSSVRTANDHVRRRRTRPGEPGGDPDRSG